MKSTFFLVPVFVLVLAGCRPDPIHEGNGVRDAGFESNRFELVVVDLGSGEGGGLWKLDKVSGQTWRFIGSGWVEVKAAAISSVQSTGEPEPLRPLTGEEVEPAKAPPPPQPAQGPAPLSEVRPTAEQRSVPPAAPGVKLASPKETEQLPKRVK